MNLNGKAFPDPHPAWGVCADELLFHTSRYADYTARRLSALSAGAADGMSGFQAHRMDPRQRACMALLLSFPPAPRTARAISQLAGAVAALERGVPEEVRRVAGECRARPHMRLTARRPKRSTGLNAVHPTDVLLHLGRRYGFGVRIMGRRVWLDRLRCDRLLKSENARVRHNLQEVLQHLNRAGYAVYTGRSSVAIGNAA